MKSASVILAGSLFAAVAVAAPMHVVWTTTTEIEIITVDVIETVYVGAETTSTAESTYQSTPTSVSSVPTSSSNDAAPSSSSVYIAPTTSSTSVYVAPTSTSTSVYVAPTSSSSAYVAPTTSETPSSTSVTPSSTSSTAAATSSSASSDSGPAAAGTSYTGDLTWYETGEGACGWTNTATDHIVAISEVIFDNALYYTANPNVNPLCGRYVSIIGTDGSAYQAKVVDRCTGCKEADLDLSEDFFNTVTDNGNGRVSDMTWTWL